MRRPAFIARQAGRPDGLLGRMLLGVMARETARFNDEVLDVLAPVGQEHVLEVGYGHGRTLAAIAGRAPEAHLAGIDVAPTALRAAGRRCRAQVDAGRLDLRTGDAAALPWPNATFDAAFAVHALYFWPDPAQTLTELHRVLRRGGRLVLGYRERSDDAVAHFPAPTYRFYGSDEVAAKLAAASFTGVVVHPGRAGTDLHIASARR